MSLYVDSSAFLKRYVDEPDSARCEAILLADPVWVAARHGAVEVRRNLARLLRGRDLEGAQRAFAADWARTHVVEFDGVTCSAAADLAERTGCRTLDALHLAAAVRVGGLDVVTYDRRQADAARALGLRVRS